MSWNASFDMNVLYPEVIMLSEKWFTKVILHWHEGHPGGMTDDLGIIADRDQYVEEELPGWYGYVPSDMEDAVRRWCIDVLENRCRFIRGQTIHVPYEDDAAMFTLRWG